ncbi:MAG: tRNA lysidine(34) synthetase TilS [Burkholderiales bacterium]|nr:tRNA lysidine(34) synthetase TilS [Burkholderiales bacterium]
MARAEQSVVEAAGRFLESFKRPVRLLIALSGGSDSTGLLVALVSLCKSGRYPGITLCACTVDHDLRPGSAEEAAAVGELCARYGISHTIRRWSGGKPATGLQAAARAERYALLVAAAMEAGADAILSAHTQDDQAETIAMRAARAPEGVGLSGMADAVLLHGAVWLFRPFLAVERVAVRAFLTVHGENWIDDPSNANTRFERVRIRQQESASAMERRPGDRLALSQKAAAFLARSVRMEEGTAILGAAAIETVLADPTAWRGLLLLSATVGGRMHTLETASAERLRGFLASGTLSRLTAGRVVFDRRREGLSLYRECRGIDDLVLPTGKTGIWDGRFRVINRSDSTIVVSAGGGDNRVPLRGPALRARRAMPCLKYEDGEGVPKGAVSLQPVVAPYGLFLPRFDLPLANALAGLLGNAAFSSPPNE